MWLCPNCNPIREDAIALMAAATEQIYKDRDGRRGLTVFNDTKDHAAVIVVLARAVALAAVGNEE